MESPQQTISTVMTNYRNFQGNFNLDKSGFDPKMPGHVTYHQMITRQQPVLLKLSAQVSACRWRSGARWR